MSWNSLAATQDFIYSCGGKFRQSNIKENVCFQLPRNGSNDFWLRRDPLPRPSDGHCAVSIGSDNIWYIDDDEIHNFNAATGEYSTTALPFKGNKYRPCAVSNGNYTYVIGVGGSRDEIWVNTNSQDGRAWHKVGYMKEGRKRHACLWYDSNIMITGGEETKASVEIFNTETNCVREAQDLLSPRYAHEMMLHNGYPTVLGGYDGDYTFNTLESYDIATGEWYVLTSREAKLPRPLWSFGFIEIAPHLGLKGNGEC